MKNKKQRSLAISLLIIILAGCEFQALNLPPSQAAPSLTGVQKTHVSPTKLAAASIPLPTVKVTKVATPTETESQTLKDLISSPCLEIQPKLLQGTDISGDLLVKQAGIPYFLNIDSGVKTAINIPKNIDDNTYFVSPNGKWLAYSTFQGYTSDLLFVEPAYNILKGNNAKRVTWGRNQLINFEGWLENDQLVVVRSPDPNSFLSTLVINPFTGEQHEFFLQSLPNYQDSGIGGTRPYFYPSGNVLPDPTLSRLVYPEFINGENYDALWDVGKKTILAQLLDLLPYQNDPLWSQDGADFIIAVSTKHTYYNAIYDWFSVTKDGLIRQLTHFGDYINENYILNASRSQDGRYLAFQMRYKEGSEEKLKYFLFDLKEQNLGGFCVDSSDVAPGTEYQPVWSPDNKYVVFSNSAVNDEGSDLILVDIEKRQAYEIAKDVHARGWLVKP